MKLLLTVCLWIAAALGCNAEGDFNHDGEGVGHAEYFHQSLHHEDRPELYLVCYYAVRVQPHGIENLAAQGWEEIVVSCTVVDSIRGPKKVGDRFEYVRYRDGKAGNTKDLLGRLTYVFFTQAAGGRFVDPQDPASEWLFSEELRRIVEIHEKPKPKAGPGAAQPAAAPNSNSKPEAGAKLESEVLPR
jgi:hypothetical protein